MTLLGEFTLGKADAGQSTLDMSLDQMIASRRAAATNTAPKNTAAVKKSVSNTDRVVGTSKAKRQAKLNARRGLTNTPKATAQQIQVEVNKQVAKSAVAKKNQQDKKNTKVVVVKTGAEKAAERKQRRQVNKAAQKAKVVEAKPPTKKQVQAAVNAMEGAGFAMPQNMQMVISFAPKQNNNKQQQPGNNKNNKNNKPPPKKTNNNNTMETEEQKKSRGRRGRGRSAAA